MKFQNLLLFSGAAVLAFNASVQPATAYSDTRKPLEERIHAALSGVKESDVDFAFSQYWIEKSAKRIQEVLSGTKKGQEALHEIERVEDDLVYSTQKSGQPAAWEDVGTTASQIKGLKVKNHMTALLIAQGRARNDENRKLERSLGGSGRINSLWLMKGAEDHLKQAVNISGKTEQELFKQNFSAIRFNYHDFKSRIAIVLSEAAAEILKATENAHLQNIPPMIEDAGNLLKRAAKEAAIAKELADQYMEKKKAEPPTQMPEDIRFSCPPGYGC
jgi:hypothetical protein